MTPSLEKPILNELNRSALFCELSGFLNRARWALFVPAF